MATSIAPDILAPYRHRGGVLLILSDRAGGSRAGLARMQVNALDTCDLRRRGTAVLCVDPTGVLEMTPAAEGWRERRIADSDLDLRARFGMPTPFTIIYIDPEGRARDASASPVASDQIADLLDAGLPWEDEIDAPWLKRAPRGVTTLPAGGMRSTLS